MGSAEIVDYTLNTGRLGQLGVEKFIVVRHGNRDGEAEVQGSSEVYFADRFEASGSYGLVDHGRSVRAYLPTSEYASWVDILRHEKPVYLHWSSDKPGDHDAEGIIHLGTGPEPAGEGPVDMSP